MLRKSGIPSLELSRDIYSVSRLNREVRAVLEGSFPLLWVEGEISNLAQPASGHIYFSLKDPAAQVRCAMFRPKRLLLGFKPGNGHHVLMRARVGLYEGRGDFQLIVEQMEPAGEGALRLELEQLKQKLAAEGLFDEACKRSPPPFPRQAGLVTSASGAAIRDLLSVLRRRFPALPVVVYPAQVQGEGAVDELVAALDLASARGECDVLILARGGGSLEDLMAFNDEAVARAIRRSAIPVVTGIGHEIDLTIADLAADRRGATPSAAGELVSPSAPHLAQRLRAIEQRLSGTQARAVSVLRQRFAAVARHLRLLHPLGRLQRQQQRVDDLERRLIASMRGQLKSGQVRHRPLGTRLVAASPARTLERLGLANRALAERLARLMPRKIRGRRERLARTIQALDMLSPLATLARGYAIVRLLPRGRVLRDAHDAQPGSRIEAQLQKGTLTALVEPPQGPDT
ncbi:MAG: exodeoxyribonuclease VII large subunit [Pseudomonadota bacterium]|nr:exodeoxyribonuclease VII large subunit [Pseudomonadota bacterium]